MNQRQAHQQAQKRKANNRRRTNSAPPSSPPSQSHPPSPARSPRISPSAAKKSKPAPPADSAPAPGGRQPAADDYLDMAKAEPAPAAHSSAGAPLLLPRGRRSKPSGSLSPAPAASRSKQAASAPTSPGRTPKAKKQKDMPDTDGEGVESDDETPAPRKTKPASKIGREGIDTSDEEGANADDEGDVGGASSPASRSKRGRSPKKSPARAPAAADDEAADVRAAAGLQLKQPPQRPAPAPDIRPPTDITTQVVNDLWPTSRFMIIQNGGMAGSYAGDAALYAVNGRTDTSIFVDVGPSGGEQNKRLRELQGQLLKPDGRANIELDEPHSSGGEDALNKPLTPIAGGETRHLGVITHSHKDHASGALPLSADRVKELYVGKSGAENKKDASKPTAGKSGAKKKEDASKPTTDTTKPTQEWEAAKLAKTKGKLITANGERVFSFRENGTPSGKMKSEKQMRMTGRAILPDTKPGETDANAQSLGIVTTVTRGAKRQEGRILTMYSLGDMTPNAGASRVLERFIADGEQPIHIVKMAHHGSDNNIAALPPEITNDNMVVLFSGFTGKGSENPNGALARFLKKGFLYRPSDRGKTDEQLEKEGRQRYKWKAIYVLYTDSTYLDELKKNTALYKQFEAANVQFVQDYVIRVTHQGNVEHHPTLLE